MLAGHSHRLGPALMQTGSRQCGWPVRLQASAQDLVQARTCRTLLTCLQHLQGCQQHQQSLRCVAYAPHLPMLLPHRLLIASFLALAWNVCRQAPL